MNHSSKIFAIYSRKSKFTGKGESIENQIELCKTYIRNLYPDIKDEQMMVFEDEGFSGKNTERPQFQAMMKEARKRAFKAIVCYRLDRISRNIGDFAKLIDEMSLLDIDFISIKESFDTQSPLGKAMMYIASVFSQLERETIAERIRDNMYELAKSGRWLGGTTPTGYSSIKTSHTIEMDERKRYMYQLQVIEDEAVIVKQIFSKFLQTNSLTKVETYTINNKIKSKSGINFNRNSIRDILKNPVYMRADEDAWHYFSEKHLDIYSEKHEFDGKSGMMVYNKTSQATGKTTIKKDITDWIIAVGKHDGLISGKDWIKVQSMLEQNASKSFRKPRNNMALLSGLLFCTDCDSYMRPKMDHNPKGETPAPFHYLCETKEKSRLQQCNVKNAPGVLLDQMVCDEVKKLYSDQSELLRILQQSKRKIKAFSSESELEYEVYQKEFSENKKMISTLILSMTKANGTPAYDYIIEQINELDARNKILVDKIRNIEQKNHSNEFSTESLEKYEHQLMSFADSFDTMDIESKRDVLRKLIHKIYWDGENVSIYFWGASEHLKTLSFDDMQNIEHYMKEQKIEPLRGDCK